MQSTYTINVKFKSKLAVSVFYPFCFVGSTHTCIFYLMARMGRMSIFFSLLLIYSLDLVYSLFYSLTHLLKLLYNTFIRLKCSKRIEKKNRCQSKLYNNQMNLSLSIFAIFQTLTILFTRHRCTCENWI